MKTITMHYKAKNDVNGNPRRCYVVYDVMSPNGVVAVYDEGYINCIGNKEHRNVLDSVEVSVSVYNDFIYLGKELGEAK